MNTNISKCKFRAFENLIEDYKKNQLSFENDFEIYACTVRYYLQKGNNSYFSPLMEENYSGKIEMKNSLGGIINDVEVKNGEIKEYGFNPKMILLIKYEEQYYAIEFSKLSYNEYLRFKIDISDDKNNGIGFGESKIFQFNGKKIYFVTFQEGDKLENPSSEEEKQNIKNLFIERENTYFNNL